MCDLQVIKFKQKRKPEASCTQKDQGNIHNSLETKVENQEIVPTFGDMKTIAQEKCEKKAVLTKRVKQTTQRDRK